MMMLLFTAAMLAAMALHFAFARREWRRSKGKAANDIDITYALREDYLGRSFREKAELWTARDSGRGDNVRTHDDYRAGDREAVDDVLVVRGELSTGSNSIFGREVWVKGDCSLGPGASARALAVDGKLRLGENVRVERWIDCRRSIEIGPGCTLAGRTSCVGTISMDVTATAASLQGSSIVVKPVQEAATEPLVAENAVCLHDVLDCEVGSRFRAAGVDPDRLRRLSTDTWLYTGDLHATEAVRFETKLLVHGSCRLPAGSSIGDVKAKGAIEIGDECRCRGAIVAGGDITVGRNTVIAGPVFSGGTLRIAAGVRAGTVAHPVAVYAIKKVELESGVTVCGKVSSAEGVSAILCRRDAQGARTASVTAEAPAARLKAGIASAIVALLIVAAPGRAQDTVPAYRMSPVRVEFGGFASHVGQPYGNWNGFDGHIWIRSNSFFVPEFSVESQLRPLGRQQNYSFFAYQNWSSRFYTTIGAAVAPQDGSLAIYYPRDREDVKAYVKVGDSRRVVLGGGFTRFDFGKPGRGQIYNTGILLYRGNAVIEGNLFINRNQPNNLISGSGLVSAQYGREGRYWIGASVGGGRELYNYVGIAPVDVKLFSYSVQIFYRKWITRHVGFKTAFFHLNKLDAYRQSGATASMFFEF